MFYDKFDIINYEFDTEDVYLDFWLRASWAKKNSKF